MTITWAELEESHFFDPTQPRDGNGRWSTTGAGHGGRHAKARDLLAKPGAGRAEAEEALRAAFADAPGTEQHLYKVDLGDLSDGDAVKLAGQLVHLNEKYPGVQTQEIVTAKLGPGVGAQVLTPRNLSGPHPVLLEVNPDGYREDWGTGDPYWTNGSGTRYLITHEFAHMLHVSAVGDYKMKPRGNEKDRHREADGWVDEYVARRGGAPLTEIEMSGYSHAGGTLELVAESFADVEINGAAALPLSKFMHGKLVEAYGKRVSRETSLTELFYDASQPRDGNGRWTSGGGSGGGRGAGLKIGKHERELDAITKHLRPQLTDAEMDAIQYLKIDAGADAVNYYHREVKGTEMEQKWANEPTILKAKAATDGLDSVFADLPPITEEITLYRGFRDSGEGYLPKNLVGAELVDDGYMFVTADRDVAKFYAEQTDGKTLIMRMKAPAGTKVLPFWALHESHVDDRTGEYTSSEAYAEMLLPRGTTLIIEGAFNMGGGVMADARIG